jgi:hypothetical protein
VAITCWYLWWERRQITHSEKVKLPAQTAMKMGAIYSNFAAACSPKVRWVVKGWSKPLQNFVKLNVDVSLDMDDLRGTTGAIIRDSKGNFVAASNNKLKFISDVLSPEIQALKHGLHQNYLLLQ